MNNKEKQIEEMRALMLKKSNSANVEPVFTDENGQEHTLPDEAIKVLNDILENAFIPFLAEVVIDNGYRKIDEVTLKLDLGDRTPEEIKQIAQQFSQAMSATPIMLADNDDDGLRLSLQAKKEKEEIKKQVAKEILTDLYKLARQQSHLPAIGDGDIAIYALKKYGVEVDE